MEKQHFSVARVVTHTKENISKFERHNERKNTTYSNTNIVAERTPMNIYFKRYDSTLNQKFDEMVKNGQISTRGLKSNAKIYNELVFDVNSLYFEENGGAAPRVQEEDMFPCRYIHPSKANHYMFRVIYYRNRISLEVFHVLTDGMGGMNFLRELLYQYLRLVHPELRETAGEKLYGGTSFNREDSFTKNYKKKKTGNSYKKEKAYRIKLEKLPKGEFGVMHGKIPISQLKPITKKYGASINEYLVALFAWSTYVECLGMMPSDKPIRIAVPVNLRPYFNSMTTKNFFAMVTAEFFPKKEEYTFEEVIEIIKDSLRKQINKEHLENVFSYGVSNQQNKLLRLVPLVIKNVVMKLVYGRSALSSSTTITNVGKVDIDPLYEPYVEMFYAFLPMSKGQELKGTVNSYKDTLVFTFSSVFTDTCIQRTFFRKMAEEGIEVAIETNGVYDA